MNSNKNVKRQKGQIARLRRIIARQSQKILQLEAQLRKPSQKRPKAKITKTKIARLVEENRTTKEIARRFGVSERTVHRYLKRFGLVGIRARGRKPSLQKKVRRLKGEWISVPAYINILNRKYHFVNVNYPRTKFINAKTLVCSGEKKNPEGKFTTLGVYYVLKQSNVYLLYSTRIKYSSEPAEFEEIYQWITQNAFDIVANLWAETSAEVERIVAYTFLNPQTKPEKVSNLEEAESG